MDGRDAEPSKARGHEKHATFVLDPDGPSDDCGGEEDSNALECIVHQFLASQRRAKDKDGDADAKHFLAHPKVANAEDHATENGSAKLAQERGLNTLVEPKHQRRQSRAMVDPTSLEKDVTGQPDQQAWTREMTKTMSELDLTQSRDEVHSRMLTKKQLSDMAWGVRELSRRLSTMRIRINVKTIFLITKIYDQDLVPKTRELTRWLLDADRDVEYVVYVEDKLRTNKKFDVAGLLDDVARQHAERRGDGGDYDLAAARASLSRRLRYWDENICKTRPHTFDFVITLGGDGTVLYASWLLGFLTKFDFAEYKPILTSAFTKGVTVSLRLRFEGTVMRSVKRKPSPESSDEDEEEHHSRRDLVEELIGEEREDAHTHRPDGTFEILNEIVVDRGPNPTMSYTEIFGDDEHFTSVLADGICVSTPTGSTAYNLAAGGSLCHPENPVMLVTSICPHTLSFRPIVLPDTIVLRVGVPYDARTASWASFDGRERVELQRGDYVTISASRYPFASVQAEGRRSEDWVNSISGKLGWNTRQKQKGFKEWDK
ncbi:hypothetical protein ACCO45_008338 [Purpureocillium lilacinum]|uniref:Uncharacterized protein n=1 Tax=Purpureocillium lilacinum TaxID=33203 RepID=A0ACC4DN14_PURLI